jgi:hypothetical protein
MTRITVLHNISRDAGFGLNNMFDRQGKFYEPRSHELVRVFEFDADEDYPDPDSLFHTFNVGEDAAMAHSEAELELAREYRARNLRSLSVGDVLVFETNGIVTYTACKSCGWEDIPKDQLRVLSSRAAEVVIRERYSFKPGELLTVTVPLEVEA